MHPTDKIIEFWTACLRKPVKSTVGCGVVVDGLHSLLQDAVTASITEEQANVFRWNLTEAVNDKLRKGLPIHIDVDYQPGPLLVNACMAAGIDGEWLFPTKTSTFIREGIAYVCKGYGAREEAL